MSAKLMKNIANGECRVRNNHSGQVRLYWQQGLALMHRDIDGHTEVDLINDFGIPVECLRGNQSLFSLVHAGALRVM